MLSVIAFKFILHVALSLICNKASFRLKLMYSPGCKTVNICCSFVDHTVKNRFQSNFGFGPQLRNASCILSVCGRVPLGIKQTVHLVDILLVLILKLPKQTFSAESYCIHRFNINNLIKFFGCLVPNPVPSVPF